MIPARLRAFLSAFLDALSWRAASAAASVCLAMHGERYCFEPGYSPLTLQCRLNRRRTVYLASNIATRLACLLWTNRFINQLDLGNRMELLSDSRNGIRGMAKHRRV